MSENRKFIHEVNTLRVLAVILVLLYHLDVPRLQGGYIGVDIFFVISGYLMARALYNYHTLSLKKILEYYFKRFKRIFPALLVVVITTQIFGMLILTPDALIDMSRSAVSSLLFYSNFFFWADRNYFGQAMELKPLLHTWSLSVEVQFYIILPIILFISQLFNQKYKHSRHLILIIITTFSFILCVYITWLHQPTAFFLLPTRLFEFVLGVLAFVNKINFDRERKTILYIIHCTGYGAIVFAAITFAESATFPGTQVLLPTLATFFILISAERRVDSITHKLYPRLFFYLGSISYSLYLVHQPIIAFAKKMQLFDDYFLFIVVLSFLLAHVLFRYIELKCQKSFGLKETFLILFFTIIIILVANITVFQRGFMDRFTEDQQAIISSYINPGVSTRKQFEEREGKEFIKHEGRILIIGDSFAMDFVNMLEFYDRRAELDIVTWKINSECGNLYLSDYARVLNFIPEDRMARCRKIGWYHDKKLISLIRDADKVFLASLWQPWTTNFIGESFKNLQEEFGLKFYVIGLKYPGDVKLRKLLNLTIEERKSLKVEIFQEFLETNAVLEKIFDTDVLLNLMEINCVFEENSCLVTDNFGRNLSYDGIHLTDAGAEFYSKGLHSTFEYIFEQ